MLRFLNNPMVPKQSRGDQTLLLTRALPRSCAHGAVPAQLSFHPDSCSAPYMGPGTCDASCGRCKPCEGFRPSDFLPPPNVTAPAGDPPAASTALPVDATPVGPNQHPSPGNTSTGFGAPAPALPPVGPVLRAPAPETSGAPAPCVADITVRSRPSSADADPWPSAATVRTFSCRSDKAACLSSGVQEVTGVSNALHLGEGMGLCIMATGLCIKMVDEPIVQ